MNDSEQPDFYPFATLVVLKGLLDQTKQNAVVFKDVDLEQQTNTILNEAKRQGFSSPNIKALDIEVDIAIQNFLMKLTPEENKEWANSFETDDKVSPVGISIMKAMDAFVENTDVSMVEEAVSFVD